MKRINLFLILSILLLGISCKNEPKEILDYVDPFIGTDGIGHTFPGATTPFGMVQLSPSNDTPGWNWCSGYHYSDNVLKGFAHNHFSGTGLTGMGDILLIPTTGEVNTKPGTNDDPDSGFRSRFSHDNEKATAGYYSVYLDDNKVNVELTTTPRVGFHRYTFKDADKQNVIFDPTHNVSGNTLNSSVEFLSDTELRGFKECTGGSCDHRIVYFYAKFSKPFTQYGVSVNDSIAPNVKQAVDKTAKAFVQFNGEAGNVVEVSVAISYVDYEGAKANYIAEAKGKTFDDVHRVARAMWKEKVEKIEIDASEDEKTIFYTSMYHNFITPNIISDVNGNYIVEGKQYNSPDIVQYSNFSTWDTYRATHPLWSIIDQEANNDMVKVLISRFADAKVGLALWEALGYDNYCMPGYPGISVLAEAALKHPEGLDVELIYQCIKESAFHDEDFRYSPNYGGDNGVRYYVNSGVIPAEVPCGVTKTTENNYYDFAIARLAEKLDKKEDVEFFTKRSLGYRNLFNKETSYLWPRLTSGEFIEMDTTMWDELIPQYVSGNIWAYSSYTPHDMLGAINLWGGAEKYEGWLDNMINNPVEMQGEEHVDIAGFIGKYSHGDEPGHQIPYLYNFVGKPWKTQDLVRRVQTEMYSHKPDGLINNEDCGQMSAWYIFSGLGFYPVAPADMNYYIGSPQFKKSTVKLENGKVFTVNAPDVSFKNRYIQSVTLNGKPLNKVYITHDDIKNGGVLEFVMGDKPNKDWGTGKDAVPQYQEDLVKYGTEPMACFSPYTTNTEFQFADELEVELKSKNKNGKIYYTLDGSDPTKKSSLYRGLVKINKSVELKAIATEEGKSDSYPFSRKFLKSVYKGLENGYPLITFENIPKKYGAKDGSQLVDSEFGSITFNDGKWTGVEGKDLEISIDLGKKCTFSKLSLNTLTATQRWRFPAKSISVFVKDRTGNYKLVAIKNNEQLVDHAKKINHYQLKFAQQTVQHLKIVIENYGVLPTWHVGAGKLPWIFVDEINIE